MRALSSCRHSICIVAYPPHSLGFLQAFSSLFAFTIFTLFQRVQLTLLSRENCLVSRASSSTASTPPPKSGWGGLLSRASTPAADSTRLTEEDKKSYLLQCNYFLSTGLSRLVALLEERLKALLAKYAFF